MGLFEYVLADMPSALLPFEDFKVLSCSWEADMSTLMWISGVVYTLLFWILSSCQAVHFLHENYSK